MEILKASKIKKVYGKKLFAQEVLKGIDLEVKEKEVVVLIGASGSGKSTLLRCLNFLEMYDEGEIHLQGERIDPKHSNLNKVRHQVLVKQPC